MDSAIASDDIDCRTLGIVPYASTRDAMIAFTVARDATTRDEIWSLQHEPVYTLGQAGRLAHLREAVEIPVVQTERGGQITYHGPGQLVVYLLIDLKRRGIKVREFVRLIEDSVIEVLAAYNLAAVTKAGAPGVYVPHQGELQKIAALGLKIVNGRSFHGLSLNVSMDLAPYDAIDACGYEGLRTIDLATLGIDAPLADVRHRLSATLVRHLRSVPR